LPHRSGKTEIVKLLIESGKYDLSAVDNQGNSIFTFYMNDHEMLELLFSHGADTGLYEREYKKTKSDDFLKNLYKSSQSSHDTDKIFIDKVYPKIRDNDSTYTLDEIKAKLVGLIDLENPDFKNLLDKLISDKQRDAESNIGQGKSFIGKIKKIGDNKVELKSYLKTCLEKTIYILNYQGQYNQNKLLGKIISEIEKKEEVEKKHYLMRLVIEACDAGDMYDSGGASCLVGTISKVLSVLEYLIPSEEKNAILKKNYDIGSVIFNEVAFLNNFAEKYKDNWSGLKNFQKAQALGKYLYDLLKGNDNEGFSEAFGYCSFQGVSKNLFNDPQNIARFKGELEYIDMSILSSKFLEEINKNLNPDISVYLVKKEKSIAPKQDINAASNQAIQAKLLDKKELLSKIKDEEFYKKINDVSAEKIAEIVSWRDLNDVKVLLSVLFDIDEGKSFEDQIVTSSDLYVRFIKDEAFDQQQQMGIPQQSWINQPNDDEVEMINTSSQPMHLAGGHHEHIHDQHQ
jgi:hypothetical protein